MASVASPADQAADLLQKLSTETQHKPLDPADSTKNSTSIIYGAESGEVPNGRVTPSSYERSMTPLLQDFMDPSICYLHNGYPSTAYYYGAYDGTVGEWDEFSQYTNPDPVEIPQGVYGDNGTVMYHAGYGYGAFPPYSPSTSPVPTLSHDGQIYCPPQHYQYPTYFQPLNPNSGPYNPITTSKPEVETTIPSSSTADHQPEQKQSNDPVKFPNQNPAFSSNPSYLLSPSGSLPAVYQDPRYGFDGRTSPVPWIDGQQQQPRCPSVFPSENSVYSSRNRPHSNPTPYGRGVPPGISPGYVNRMYPNKVYGNVYGNVMKPPGIGFGSSALYDSRTNGNRGWLAVDSKFKPRGRGNGGGLYYGNENSDGLNEMSRGPRAKNSRNPKLTPAAAAAATSPLAVKSENGAVAPEADAENPDRETYNRADFREEYDDARFFIIKSYSEDDVHKSIKYSMWASTPNGNKKLDASYRESREKANPHPIFLLFSVNTSGQFVGLAEMVGAVDFHRNLEYWQQDKWNGCFPVKWHVVKDVPNSLLKHITLQNNENKPVTNSRDTQEVKLEQGIQIIRIFKEHCSKTCILDDFGFYEARQMTIQEKKARQQQFQKQVWDASRGTVVASGENGSSVESGKTQGGDDDREGGVDEVRVNGY